MIAGIPSVLVVGPEPPSEPFVGQVLDRLAGRGHRVGVTSSRHLRGRVPAGCVPVPMVYPVYAHRRQLRNLLDVLAADPVGTPLAALPHLRSKRNAWTEINRRAMRGFGVAYFPWVSAAVGFGPLLPGTPVVVSCRGSQVLLGTGGGRDEAYDRRVGDTLRSAAAVHCVSGQMAEVVVDRFAVDPARIHVIRPAVDTVRFRPPAGGRAEGPPVVIGIGRLTWVKGWAWALEAMREVLRAAPDARLILVGEGEDRQQLEFTIRDLGIEHAVELRGRVPHEEVRALLDQATLLVSTSLSEGISNVVLEAMACGLPVVSTDVGGMSEVVVDGDNGFLVPPRAAAATAARIVQLLDDPARRAALGACGRATVLAGHDLERQVDAFEDLFRAAAEVAR